MPVTVCGALAFLSGSRGSVAGAADRRHAETEQHGGTHGTRELGPPGSVRPVRRDGRHESAHGAGQSPREAALGADRAPPADTADTLSGAVCSNSRQAYTLSGGVCTDSTETADTLSVGGRTDSTETADMRRTRRKDDWPSGGSSHTGVTPVVQSHWSDGGGITPHEQLTHYDARLGRSAHTAVTNR